MGWAPPEDWHKRILGSRVSDGVGLPLQFTDGNEGLPLISKLKRFIDNTRRDYPLGNPVGVPTSVLTLACIKHVSPLPSEFWRASIFGPPNDPRAPEQQPSPKA